MGTVVQTAHGLSSSVIVAPAQPSRGAVSEAPLRAIPGGLEPLDLGSILLRTTQLTQSSSPKRAPSRRPAVPARRSADRQRQGAASDEVLRARHPARPADPPRDRGRRGRPDADRDGADRLRQAARDPAAAARSGRRRARGGREPARHRAARRSAHALRRRRGASRAGEPAHDPGAINEVYDRGAGSTDALAEDAAEDLTSPGEQTSAGAPGPARGLGRRADHPLVNSLLHQAVKERASDIHIEPREKEIRVRFRIDGVLLRADQAAARGLQASIVSRIKIMGGLNIAEKRLPQDGRIRLKIAGRDHDVRVSTVPIAVRRARRDAAPARTQRVLNLETHRLRSAQLR